MVCDCDKAIVGKVCDYDKVIGKMVCDCNKVIGKMVCDCDKAIVRMVCGCDKAIVRMVCGCDKAIGKIICGCDKAIVRMVCGCDKAIVRMVCDCDKAIVRMVCGCDKAIVRMVCGCDKAIVRMVCDCDKAIGRMVCDGDKAIDRMVCDGDKTIFRMVARWLCKHQHLVFLIYCIQVSNCAITQIGDEPKARYYTGGKPRNYHEIVLTQICYQATSGTRRGSFQAENWIKKASHICKADPGNANQAIIIFGVVPKSDPIYRIYAFDASSTDTIDTNNRILDCYQNGSVATNPNQDRIPFTITVDFTASSGHDCGVHVTGTTVKTMAVQFRTQAYVNVLTGDDVVYRFECYSDNLADNEIATPGYSGSVAVVVDLLEPNRGVYIRVRQNGTNVPLSIVPLGEPVYVSLEFVPGLREGSDSYGIHFFIGFLGNDPHPTTATSTSSLFLCVIPRYAVNTYVTVTSQFGSVSLSAVNRDILTFPLSTDLMGCSENGIAEIDDKGVEINSTHEISVQVYNRESGSEDYYTALPVDILSTRYTSISKGATGEVAELMIIGTDADTAVDLTLPAYTHAQVTLNSDTISAGETLSFTLQDREVFHLSVPNYSVSGFHINSTKPVALITGDRKDVSDHSVDQVPPEKELGKHYVLVPANPADDNRDTTYIIQAIADGNTIVSRYLSSTTMQNYTISRSAAPLKLTVAYGSPCEIVSDNVILVAQLLNPAETTGGYDPAMLILPSVQQWAPSYNLYTKERPNKLAFVFPSAAAATNIKIRFSGNEVTASASPLTDVKGPSGYKFNPGLSLASDTLYTVSSINDITLFMALVYSTNIVKDVGTAYLPFGYRYPTTGECKNSTNGKQGDKIDNDCDGLIDEELLNFKDDDLDSFIDEDIVEAAREFVDVVGIQPKNCKSSGTSDFSDPNKLHQMTLGTGCVNPNADPFEPDAEYIQSVTSDGRKIYNSGVFLMAMYEGESNVYIKCELDHCYSESDTKCTTAICDTSGTRKREAESDKKSSVETHVQVVPRTSETDKEDTESGSSVDPVTCLENTYFLVIFIVLLIVAILSFGTALCFCCLFRQRRNEAKSRDEYGFHRKSF